MKPLLLMLSLAGVVHAAESAPIAVDADRGRRAFAVCAACHREASTEVPNPGPDLRGVLGRPAGSVPGFRYSRALRKAKRTWNEETLFAFLGDPQAAIPGNTMPFPGLPDEAQRRDVIAYLKAFK
jgi:cytochrome c